MEAVWWLVNKKELLKEHLRFETILADWKSFKNCEKCFLFYIKLSGNTF